jgi:hypothetical protein
VATAVATTSSLLVNKRGDVRVDALRDERAQVAGGSSGFHGWKSLFIVGKDFNF